MKLYSVVIKEDTAEQLSPTFNAKKGFFQMNNNPNSGFNQVPSNASGAA